MMQKSDFRFSHPLRVRWSEADMQGIVFNGHYLNYADVGISEYFRELRTLADSTGITGSEFFAVRTLLEYQSPAQFDDMLDVYVRISRLGNSSMDFTIGIFRDNELLVTGEIVYVRADMDNRRPQAIPQAFRDVIADYETTTPEGAEVSHSA